MAGSTGREFKEGKPDAGRERPYLIVVKAEHVSPPGPHGGIGKVGVTSCT